MAKNWNNPRPPRPDQIDLAQPVDFSHPQARGLVAWWPMWLARSIYQAALDRGSRRSNAMTLYGSPALAGDSTFRRHASLNGSSMLYRNAAPAVAAEPLTLEAWFRQNTSHDAAILNITQVAGTNSWCIFAFASYAFFAQVGNAAGSYGNAASTAAYGYGTWRHLLGSFASSTSRSCYVNGASKGTGTTSISVTGASCDTTRIGELVRSGVAGYWLTGAVGEARIYNRALNDAEAFARWHPATRWAMLRTLTFRRTFIVPAPTTNRRRRALTGAVA